MRNIVLVFPRFKYPSGDFSIGLASLCSYLREKLKDANVSILDTSFNPSLKYVKNHFRKHNPQVVGIYADTMMFRDALRVARIAKAFGSKVIFGGPHPSIMPESVLKSCFVDALCIGEGELAIKEYAECVLGGKDLGKVKSIWYKKEGKIFKNPPMDPIENLDFLPFPAYDCFDMEAYMERFVQLDSYDSNLRGVSIIMSRGCPFQCSYCQPTLNKIFGRKVRIRSPGNVIEELKLLKSKYGIEAFYFQDDTLTVFKEWLKEFCSLIKKEKLNLVWACNTRADTVDYESIKMMKGAGLIKMKVGIESITDRIRNGIYKKNLTKKQILDLIGNCKKLGVQTAGFFMLGAPTETVKEVWNTINFAANSDLMEANFSITTPLPETGLYDFVLSRGWNLPRNPCEFDYYQVRRPKMSESEISIWKLKMMKKIANFYFYLHPKRIIVTFKSIVGVKGLKKLLLKLRRL